jgi:hypothetical protein
VAPAGDENEVVTTDVALSASDTSAVLGLLTGALVAALGYVGKLVVESVQHWRAEQARSRVRLHQLKALLRASHTAFLVQNDLAVRLARQVQARFPDEAPARQGFEQLFAHYHDRFTVEEADVHRVIRGYTDHALHPLNEALLHWLRDDAEYRITQGKTGKAAELALLLNRLDEHVILWLAKYEAWLPDQPAHALVYLDDEERHGVGFPRGLDDAVDEVLERR